MAILLSEMGSMQLFYRAMPISTDFLRHGDYITMIRRFAIEHAITSSIYHEEDYGVFSFWLQNEQVKEADNPGEYRYIDDDNIRARLVGIAKYDGFSANSEYNQVSHCQASQRAILSNEYSNIREYTDEELDDELLEYFGNEYTRKLIPDAFSSPEELRQKIISAKPRILNDAEYMDLGNNGNSNILDVLESNDPTKTFEELAESYGRDAKSIWRGFQNQKEFPPPIVLRDRSGRLYLLAGNTRLMAATAAGLKIPVKVIDIDEDFDFKMVKGSSSKIILIKPNERLIALASILYNAGVKDEADMVLKLIGWREYAI